MSLKKGKKIVFLGFDDGVSSEVIFNSVTDLSKHLSISIPRVVNFLDGRTVLSEKDYELLVKMSYEMPKVGVGLGNKNKKRVKV
jgi:hypothetical protein